MLLHVLCSMGRVEYARACVLCVFMCDCQWLGAFNAHMLHYGKVDLESTQWWSDGPHSRHIIRPRLLAPYPHHEISDRVHVSDSEGAGPNQC